MPWTNADFTCKHWWTALIPSDGTHPVTALDTTDTPPTFQKISEGPIFFPLFSATHKATLNIISMIL